MRRIVAMIPISKPRSGLCVARFRNSGKNAAHRSDDPDFEATVWLMRCHDSGILGRMRRIVATIPISKPRSRPIRGHDSGILRRIRRIVATIPISKLRSGSFVLRFRNFAKNGAHRSDDPNFIATIRFVLTAIPEFWEEYGASWRRSRFRRYDPLILPTILEL